MALQGSSRPICKARCRGKEKRREVLEDRWRVSGEFRKVALPVLFLKGSGVVARSGDRRKFVREKVLGMGLRESA